MQPSFTNFNDPRFSKLVAWLFMLWLSVVGFQLARQLLSQLIWKLYEFFIQHNSSSL